MTFRHLSCAFFSLAAVASCSPEKGGSDGANTGGTGTGGASGSSGGSSSGGVIGDGSGGSLDGSGGGDSSDPCEGLVLCDSFEDAEIDDALWDVELPSENPNNTMEITTEQSVHGSQSVHIHAENGYARLRNTSAFPMPNNDYFGRMYLRVARYSTVDWAHWTIGEGAGTGDGSLIRVGGQYDTGIQANRWGVGSDGGPTGDWTRRTVDPEGNPEEPPEGFWTCLEWEHKGSTNETRFFVNGVEHPSLYTTSSDHGGTGEYILPEMTSFWFGWWQYQADPEPFDVWIDMVALDDERIGCL